jgi:hypothetical protein
VIRHRVSARLPREARRTGAPAEGIGELREGREQIHDTEARHGAPHVVVGQERADGRQRLDEVVSLPERRPRDENQQQSCFEQERDEQQTSEQGGLPSGWYR